MKYLGIFLCFCLVGNKGQHPTINPKNNSCADATTEIYKKLDDEKKQG